MYKVPDALPSASLALDSGLQRHHKKQLQSREKNDRNSYCVRSMAAIGNEASKSAPPELLVSLQRASSILSMYLRV